MIEWDRDRGIKKVGWLINQINKRRQERKSYDPINKKRIRIEPWRKFTASLAQHQSTLQSLSTGERETSSLTYLLTLH